jgi:hypothetical protein
MPEPETKPKPEPKPEPKLKGARQLYNTPFKSRAKVRNANIDPNKPLTAKQQGFATSVATGKTQTEAMHEHYQVHPTDFKQHTARRASEIAHTPHVAQEIRELTWSSCPNMDDVRGMRGHALRTLFDLSKFAVSEDIRFRCALSLLQISETTRLAAHPKLETKDQDQVLGLLRGFYNKIQQEAKELPAANELLLEEEPAIDIKTVGE